MEAVWIMVALEQEAATIAAQQHRTNNPDEAHNKIARPN